MRRSAPVPASERLKQRKVEIIQRFTERVKVAIPEAGTEPHPVLADHMPQILDCIAEQLDRGDPRPDLAPVRECARVHAKQRAHLTEFSLAQIIAEYRVLRKVTLTAIDANGNLTGDERQKIHEALDEAIAQAVIEFTFHVQSSRMNSERELKRFIEERYELVTRATRDAIWDWDFATDTVIWNEAIVTEYGYSRAEMRGPAKWWYDRVHPDDRERVVSGVHQVIEGGEEHWDDEYRYQRADGTYAVVLDRGYVVRDPSGRATRMIGAMQDITEQTRVWEALEESESRFRVLSESMPQIVWTARPDGFVDWYNQRWYDYTGASRGSGWDEPGSPMHPDDIAPTWARWKESIETGKPYEMEYRFRRASDGQYRWHLGRAVPVKDRHGNIVKWLGTNTDIHDRIEAERLLSETLRARDEFLSIASHELKTPLTSLSLQAQMAKRNLSRRPESEVLAPDRMKRLIEQTDRAAQRLNRLVDDMLDISRIATGKLTIHLEEFDLCDLIREVLDRMRPDFVAAECPVGLECCDQVTGRWDRFRIEQIIANLFTNAMKYGRGTRVLVQVMRQGDFALLAVSDQGPGIPAASQERIFQRFERAISASEVSGLGLGLFISREIAERHGGSIRVVSEPGKGAEFQVRLPLGRP